MTAQNDTIGAEANDARSGDSSRFAFLRLIFAIVAASLLTFSNLYIGNLVPIPSFGSPAGHFVSILYLAALLFALMQAAQAAAHLKGSAAFLIAVGFAFAFPVFVTILSGVGTAIVSHPFAALAGTLDALPYAVRFATSNLLGPLGMILIGVGIGRIFRHTNTLLAGAGFAIFFDLVVVTMGTVAQLMKNNSSVISMVSVGAGATGAMTAPTSGFHHHTIATLSSVTIGPADILFLAVFLGAVYSLRLASRATFWTMYVLLLTALALVETTALPVPALVPMGLSVLIANGRFAAFTRTEKRDLAIGGAFALLCATLMIGAARRLLPTPPPQAPHYGFMVGHVKTSPDALVVLGILPGSPAERDGLHAGDVIVAAGGVPLVGKDTAPFDAAHKNPAGMSLRIRRLGETKPIDLLLHPAN